MPLKLQQTVSRIIQLFFLIITIIFLALPASTRAYFNGNYFPPGPKFGIPCAHTALNTDCAADCEDSTKINDQGQKQAYCDCGSDDDCLSNYGPTNDGGIWKCIDGANKTYDLDYCQSTAGQKLYPIPLREKNPSLKENATDFIFDPNVAITGMMNELKQMKPTPAIHIPGLQYTNVVSETDSEGNTNVYIPWLAQFLTAAYKFGMIVCSAIAVALIIKKGFDIIISRGENSAEHYKRIGQIVIGLFLMWGSYAILYNINPRLVEFQALKVGVITRMEVPERSSATTERPPEVQAAFPSGKGKTGIADATQCPNLAPGTVFKGAFTTYWNVGKSHYGQAGKYKGSYHGPPDPSLKGMEDFFCQVSMECGCPSQTGKGGNYCGNRNWAVCKYFDKDANWCQPKDYIAGGSVAASTCFPYNCKLETGGRPLIVKDRGAGIIGTHFDLYLGVDDQPNFTKDTSWLVPDSIKVVDCSQKMAPAFRTKWQGYYNKPGYGKPGVCKPGYNC